nr:PREDICTED: melanopsin-like [Latimeria chalumnae]|eukprot:XP_005986166.1 PREDICTED: melanopsin-like [Latimeria chalumnae]
MLVALGIVGNSLVIWIVLDTARAANTIPSSDFILLNIAVVNLLISLTRNTLLLALDIGYTFSMSDGACRILMCIWVWFRCVGVWVTLCLSFFHFMVIRSSHSALGKINERRNVIVIVAVLWALNLLYSSTALALTSNTSTNISSLVVISSTIRPLLGCVWIFSTDTAALFYGILSFIVHEIIPIFLMVITNCGTLFLLYKHHRQVHRADIAITRVESEWKAAKTILALILLFVFCWGTHIVSVNYYNFYSSSSTRYMLIIARFSASGFLGFYPLVVTFGHSKLKRKFHSAVLFWRKQNEVS